MASPPAGIGGVQAGRGFSLSRGAEAAQKPSAISPVASLFAGCVAGAIEASVTYPFEFAKTRAQLGHPSPSRNPFLLLAHTVRNDGVATIYTGCTALILGTALKAGVRFLSYDSIKRALTDENGRLSPARGVLAGMFAGTVESVVAVTPTERIKTALIDDQRGAKRFKSALHGARTFVAQRGFTELYRGLASTTAKQSATSAVRMGSYNVLREQLGSRCPSPSQMALVPFVAGALAGTITVYATQPFDTVKTRSQSAEGATISNAVRDIYCRSGLRGFWSGSTMRLGRLMLSGGIVFTVYERVAKLLS